MKYIKNMKHIIALLFAFACYQADAQNLQFSQVISENVAQGSTLIVPNGKVWKIEFVRIDGNPSITPSVKINGDKIRDCQVCSANYFGQFPIWTKGGDIILYDGGNGYFSAIEFTLVP